MKLEKEGVLGEGMSFTPKERAVAATINIDNFVQGVTDSQIQIGSPRAQQIHQIDEAVLSLLRDLVSALDNVVHEQSSTEQDSSVDEVRAELDTLRAQVNSPRPKRGVVKESLKSLRTILEGAAGSVLASNAPALIDNAARILTMMT